MKKCDILATVPVYNLNAVIMLFHVAHSLRCKTDMTDDKANNSWLQRY